MKTSKKIPSYLRDTLSRLEDRLGGVSSITAVGDWLIKHTKLEGKTYSFKDHEFQLAIVNDTSPHVIIQKPSQMGMTELSFRMMLALAAIRQYFTCIYVLPSAHFAREVSKSRVDPIIEDSERLSSMVVSAANSAEMKRIGTSTIYMGGAATKNQAISRPSKGLIIDEKDFANPTVLTSYQSRLRHTLESERFVREFSTPTVSGYGINADLERSNHHRYMVCCSNC